METIKEKKRYPIEKERALMYKLREGNLNESKRLINDLLGYIFFSSNKIGTLKYRTLEICFVLSRTAIDSGADPEAIFPINERFAEKLETIKSLEAICQETVAVLNEFLDCMFPCVEENKMPIRNAMYFIAENFMENLTLDDVADYVHLNPSYFSRIFKQTMGITYKEYLTKVRVEESKRLLRYSEIDITDIALSVGFDNQSYFSKVFKKVTGLTPKQFRGQENIYG